MGNTGASFHAYVCMTEWLGCIACLIYGICEHEKYPYLWYTSLIAIFAIPVFNELFLTAKGRIFRSSVERQPSADYLDQLQSSIPIVYSAGYNIHAFGAEKLHPFDAAKYRRVFAELVEHGTIRPDEHRVHAPGNPSREFMQHVMSPWYLFTLNYSWQIYKAIELPVFIIPDWILRFRLLDPMQKATRGSVDAACIAHRRGWAINLSGGYHHATRSQGGGFCVYPDITFVTRYMEEWFGYKRFLIIDLDAHQGNGHERDHTDKDKYYIIDAYNHEIYPDDRYAKQFISDDIDVYEGMDDTTYLQEVEASLAKAFREFKPDFVIYNAGTDCMVGDPLGCLTISEQGIVQRDELIFQHCYAEKKVPVVMLLSGGYQQSNAPVIASSIQNLISRFNLLQQKC